MSEPLFKRPHTSAVPSAWRTGTSKRYWDQVRAGHFDEARTILTTACATEKDSEALFEMGLIHEVDREMGLALHAYFEATQLGHPVAFCYYAHHGQLIVAMEATGNCDGMEPRRWSINQRAEWSELYVKDSGSALASWAWKWIFQQQRLQDDERRRVLRSALEQEDTPHVQFLLDEVDGNYEWSALQNHRVACYRYAGGVFGVRRTGDDRVPTAQRFHFLRIAAQ